MSIVTNFLTFIFSVALSRAFGKAGLGQYALFAGILMPFWLLLDFGLNMILVRGLNEAPHDASHLVQAASRIRILLLGVSMVALVGIGFAWMSPQERGPFWLFSLVLLPRGLAMTYIAVFQAKTAWPTIFSANALGAVGQLVAVLGVMLLGGSLTHVFAMIFLADIGRALYLRSMYLRKTSARSTVRLPFRMVELFPLMKQSLPFALIGVVSILYVRVDVYMLAHFRTLADVGVYSASYNFLLVLSTLPNFLFLSLYPVLTSRRDAQTKATLSRWGITWGAVIGVASALGLFVVAEPLIQLSYRFEESVGVLRVLAWTLVPLSINTLILSHLFAASEERFVLAVVSLALVANVAMALYFIRDFGAMGAAVTTLLSEVLRTLLYGPKLLRIWEVRPLTAPPQRVSEWSLHATAEG